MRGKGIWRGGVGYSGVGRALTVAGAVLLALWFIAPPPEDWLEHHYARGLYPRVAAALVPLTSALPVSLAAVLVVALPLAWLVAVAALLRRGRYGRALRLTLGLAVALGLSFVLLWGANYRRASVEAQFGLAPAPATQADLERLLEHLGAVIADTADAPRDEARAAASLRVALQDAVEEATGVRPVLPERVKLLPPGLLIRVGGASGIVSPWTLEAHLDGALPDVSRLAIGAHELAHVAGYAGEADADFISILAGLRADDGYARYAVALRTYADAAASLPPAARSAWLARLPAVAQDDLRRMRDPYLRYAPPAWLGVVQRALYDRYLRTQGVEAGILDYSRSTTLLIAAQRQGMF